MNEVSVRHCAVGNAAKLREALVVMMDMQPIVDLLDLTGEQEEKWSRMMEIGSRALAVPARNCDVFADLHDAWLAWQAYCAEHMGAPVMKFHVWLYAKAEGSK